MTQNGTLYRVEHVTRFRYSEPVRESVVTLYLQPRSDASQHLESGSLPIRARNSEATRIASATPSISSTSPVNTTN